MSKTCSQIHDIGGPGTVFIFPRPQGVFMLSFAVQSMLSGGKRLPSDGNEWHAFVQVVTGITILWLVSGNHTLQEECK